MAFIEQTDLERYIDADDLAQIVDDNTEVIPGAIDDAIEYSKEMLRQRYDVDFEFAQVAPDRHRQLLKQTIAITLFFISERLPTDVLPENRGMAYERAVDWLKQVASGARMPSLKKLDEATNTGASIRYGNSSSSNNNKY